MSDELKPCPFCGSDAIIQRDESSDYIQNWSYDIFCSNDDCGCMFCCTSKETKEQAIKAWNTRIDQKAILDELAKEAQEMGLYD